jgi:kynurenine formamidase
MPTLYDLTHPLETGMTFYPGDPEPRLVPAEMTPPWRVTELHLGTHTGTHIDAASHFVPGGRTIDEYLLTRFLVSGVVPVTQGDDEPIPPQAFAGVQSEAVIIRAGWDRFWKTERYLRHPFLSPEAARYLVEAGVTLVGIDALNVDSTADGTSHAHEILLGSDVFIVENLARLDQLEAGRAYQFSFLPLLLAGLDGSPVRAVATSK